ncbi:Uncharacterised protein [[Clostridium] sordellii]|uniref:hypothetical protein n=1 Tax=Paraclostridium sordellii TaxID=1505 RepID=UPI0005DD58AE|nr:hypothetical protein [Paeniclostridium sordellii]CEN21858.1 Uncharacterised protein [[Clostridium] sordellii] [Paeniclostridium sordellii]CEP88070.1 Uncharacterised protein [[Clostridium] sordellii] [Paeniclostridium sordellii]
MIRHKKKSLKSLTFYLINLILSISIIMYSTISSNSSEELPYIGFAIIILSITLLIRARHSGRFLILIAVIVYINISIGVGDCIYKGIFTSGWQILRGTHYDVINAKSVLLTITVLNLMFRDIDIKKIEESSKELKFKPINNIYCFYFSIAFICIALVFGYSRVNTSGGYVSNGSPLYEYSTLIFIFGLYFSGMKKNRITILLILLITYIVQAFFYGDRSSSFMLILMVVSLFIRKVNLVKMIAYSIGGITIANVIAIYRKEFGLSIMDIYELIIERGVTFFLSDTVGFSYYAGETIIATKELVGNKIPFIVDFIKYIFIGGNIDKALLGNYSKQFYFNQGGGMYHSYFYFWGGFIGVIIGSIVLSIIIKRVFHSKSQKNIMLGSYIIGMSLRWYLYGTTTFYRSTLFIFIIVYYTYYLIFKITKK